VLLEPNPAKPEPKGNCVLDAEAQSTRRKTRRKPRSKPESAELAETAEKGNSCQFRHEFDSVGTNVLSRLIVDTPVGRSPWTAPDAPVRRPLLGAVRPDRGVEPRARAPAPHKATNQIVVLRGGVRAFGT